MMSSTHPISNRRIYPDNNITPSHNNNHLDYCNEIATIKTTLVIPSEVTFHDCDMPKQRKRLTTISSETTDGDLHASSSTINVTKTRKIPDGGYGWVVSLALFFTKLHFTSTLVSKEIASWDEIDFFLFISLKVVFASLMVSLIADGISFSFGLIYTELLKSFNEGETKTAIVGSLFMSVPL